MISYVTVYIFANEHITSELKNSTKGLATNHIQIWRQRYYLTKTKLICGKITTSTNTTIIINT